MKYTPLCLHPCYKETLWGGERLKKEYGKSDAPDVTAESWELAVHPDGMSTVVSGPLRGKTLQELGAMDKNGFWGTDCSRDCFPILVKLIDAQKDLSIQVHPSDRTALTKNGEQGKAEMWYVMDSVPQAAIYFGFSRRVTPEEILRRSEDGSICEVLNRVPVKKGDVFYITPGTIHAIGAGILVAEIQQNSNTTFRVYDFKRRGADGKQRALQLERAIKVLNCEPMLPEDCKANSTVCFPAFTMTEMFSCRYFKADRLDVHTEIRLLCDGCSFQYILCVEGSGEIVHDGTNYPFERGTSYFLPAAMGDYTIRGTCRVLLSRI
jgi:mannose-6-phosphate isomerase class I